MFESILEKVLLKAAGDYIEGIDSNNLKVGIWGGDVVIENVSLKEGIIDMLNLPVELRFSHIGKLTLKVPWKNLSSAPVEVYLDGVYLVLSPKHQSQWVFKDLKDFKDKFDNINEYANECLQTFQSTYKKQNMTKKDQGYMDKLTLKIIDNLQLNIKSIHVRYEDTLASKPFSWGLTLDQLDIYTVDKYEKRIYVDRTLKENKEEPMRKVLELSNLGVYWNSQENNMLYLEDKDIKLDVMEGMIKRGEAKTRKECEYLLSISFKAKLIQSRAGLAVEKPDIPEIALSIDLDRINFVLEQQQMQQIIKMAEFFALYQRKLADQKKVDKQLPESEIKKNLKYFSKMYKSIQESESKDLDALENDDKDRFQTVVTSLEYEDLYECTKQVMIEIAKKYKIEQIEKEKQKKKQGFFGGWFGGKKKEEEKESLVTEDDLKNIDEFFEDNFGGEGLTVTNYTRPQSYIWFVLQFTMKGGRIQLNKENRVSRDTEGIQFEYNNLGGSVLLRDNNMELATSLKDIQLDNVTHIHDTDEISIQNFLRPNQTVSDENLINVSFEQKPVSAPHIDTKVKVDIKSARIEYNPIFVQRITMFFDVKVEDEELKNAALDKAEEIKANVQESSSQAMVSQSVLWLDVHLASPIIVLPFKPDGSLQNEAWILNLGDLKIATNPKILCEKIEEQNKFKDMLDIQLSDIRMQYFPELQYYNQYELDHQAIWQKQENKVDKYTIIDNFSIKVGVIILKNIPKEPETGKIQVQGELPCLQMNLNPEMYKRLIKMGQIFIVQEEKEKTMKSSSMDLESLQMDRKSLMKDAKHLGPLMVRGDKVHTWEKKTAVLSGKYIYLFASPKDTHPENYYWVNNSDIVQQDPKIAGYNNAFLLKNRYTELYLANDKESQAQKWISALESIRTRKKKLDNFDSFSQSQVSSSQENNSSQLKKKEQKKEEENMLQKNMQISFSISNVQLKLYDTGNQKEFLIFQTRSIGLQFDQFSQSFDCKLSLGGMYLEDSVDNYLDPSLKNFITSEDDTQDTDKLELIVVSIEQKNRVHPHFKNVEMDIQVKFGNLLVNFKPNTLLKVLNFIKVEEEQSEPDIQQQQEEDQQIQEQQSELSSRPQSQQDSDMDSSIIEPQQQLQQDIVLMQASVQLKQIKLKFVNRKTKLAIGQIQIQNIDIQFQQLQDEMALNGTLGNLQLIDLTNYPDTIYEEEDYEKAQPVEILGLLKEDNQNQNKQESLLHIHFRSLQDKSPKIKEDNVTTFLKVKLSQININYMMQPIMRFLDYSLVQLLGPLSTPELFTEEGEFMTMEEKEQIRQKKKEIKDPMVQLRQLSKKQVKKDLINPKGMQMEIDIIQPLIQLKPNNQSQEYMQIALGNIHITNKRVFNEERIISSGKTNIKQVYSEQFLISLTDMQLGFIRNGKYIEMSQLFHFNIKIDMPGFSNEYWYVYKDELQIDRTMKLKCFISPIIIRLTQQDYCLIMKCLFHNVSFDDGCDRFMIHDYWQMEEQKKEMEKNKVSKLQAAMKFKTQANQPKLHKKSSMFQDENLFQTNKNQSLLEITNLDLDLPEPGGIDFQLDMDNLSLFTAEGEKSIPFARVTLDDLRIQFIKDPNGDVQTNLYGGQLDGSCFKYDPIQELYIESGLFRQIDVNKTYTELQMQVVTNLLDTVQERSVLGEQITLFEFEKFPDTVNQAAFLHNKLQFVMELSMFPNGDKKMKIKVQDFKVIAETGHLLKLSGFAQTDDSVIPPPPRFDPKKNKDTSQDQFQAQQQLLQKHSQKKDNVLFDIEEEEQEKKQKEEQENEEDNQQGKMEIDVIVRNVIICALIPNSNQILAIKGEFDIGIIFQPRSTSPEDILEKVKELKEAHDKKLLQIKQEREQESLQQQKQKKKDKKIKEEKNIPLEEEFPFRPDNDLKHLNQVQKFDVNLQQLEIFICNKADLQTKEFNQVQKRTIMHPFDISLLMQTYNPPVPPKYNTFYQRQVIDVDIKLLFLKISSKDTLLLQDSLNYITDSMNEGKSPEQLEQEKLEKEKQKQEQEEKNKEGYDDRLKLTAEQKEQLMEMNEDPAKMTESLIKCKMSGIRIMIINDIGNIFTPVLDFNILNTEMIMNNNALQSKISVIPLIFKAKYYNPRAGEWEPIIEEVGFNIDIINNTIGTIKQHIVVEINENYNNFSINFSTQFLIILLQLLNIYSQNIKKKELLNNSDFKRQDSNDSINKSISVDSISSSLTNTQNIDQKVSPYTIKNETGYPLELDLQDKQQHQFVEKTQVKNNQQQNFDISSEMNENKFFEEQQKEETLHKIRSQNQQLKVQLNIKNLKQTKDFWVKDIDIDRMRSEKIYFNSDKSIYGSTEVRLDMVTNRKILYISSPYVFENNTKNKIMLKFGPKSNTVVEGEAIRLKPKDRLPLPIDCINQYYQFSLYDKNGIEYISTPQKVSDLGSNKKLDIKLSNSQRFLRLRCQLDDTNRHKTIIYMEAPFKFKNCLPKPLYFQVLSHSKRTTVTKQIDTDEIYEEFTHSAQTKIYLKISLPGFFWSTDVMLSPDNNLTHIPIQDHNSNYSGIQVNQTQIPNGTIQYYFYCTSYLINESKYDLLIHTRKSKQKPILVGGQDEIMPGDEIEKNLIIFGQRQGELLLISDRQTPEKLSQEIGIATPGNSEIEAYVYDQNQEQRISMGIDIKLQRANQEPLIMTKQITVSPRYILVNNTNHRILVKQDGETKIERTAILKKDQRQPIFWPNSDLQKLVNLQLFENEQVEKDPTLITLDDSKWDFSHAINVNNIGIINFAVHSKDKSEILFLRTDTRESGSNVFIVIEEVKPEEIPYKIINNTSLVDIEMLNEGYDGKLIKGQESSHYSWFKPEEAKKLSLNLIPINGNYDQKHIDFCPDIINNKEKFQIKPIKNVDHKLIHPKFIKKTISIQGFTKIITFEDSLRSEKLQKNKKKDEDASLKNHEKAREEIKEQDDLINRQSDVRSTASRQSSLDLFNILQQINISFKGIGLSLIMNHKATGTKEILYLYMKNLELIRLQKQKSMITQLRLQYINIDNNAEHIVQHPVIFTPSHQKAHTNTKDPKNILNIYIDQNLTTETITLYDNIIIEVEPFTIKIEEAFLNSILDFYSAYTEINESINADLNAYEKRKEIQHMHDHLKRKEYIWQTAEIPPASAPTFIDQIILDNININLTFQAKSRTGSSSSTLPLFETLFAAIGVVLANIDDAPIKLKGKKLNACFDTMNGIVSKLVSHYKSQAITEGLKVLGSLNVIGNPVGLFSNISSGVEDFVSKPMEGLVQGPLETGLGIASGSASLLTKTISGAFNSVSKITGSVSSGIAALTMDEEYMKEREKMRANKPKHIVDGIGGGVVSIVGGIGKGIAGVFLKPFEGAKKDGIKGFFKGTVMGITGLVTKPITGAIDAVTQTAEGMKNMVSFMEDKPNTQRERAPRVFYGYDKYYKEYYDLDAEMLTVLQLYKKAKHAKEDFFTTFQFKSQQDQKHNYVLILLLSHIILLSEESAKRVWIIQNSNVDKLRYTQEGIQFHLKSKNKYTKSQSIVLGMTDKTMQQNAYNCVTELLDVFKDEQRYLAKDQLNDIED